MAVERFSSDVLQMFDESEMPEKAMEEQVLANEIGLKWFRRMAECVWKMEPSQNENKDILIAEKKKTSTWMLWKKKCKVGHV